MHAHFIKPLMRRTLTGVEQDHGFETHILLSLQLEFSEPGRGCQQHIKNLQKPLHTAAFIPDKHKDI